MDTAHLPMSRAHVSLSSKMQGNSSESFDPQCSVYEEWQHHYLSLTHFCLFLWTAAASQTWILYATTLEYYEIVFWTQKPSYLCFFFIKLIKGILFLKFWKIIRNICGFFLLMPPGILVFLSYQLNPLRKR